METCCSDNPDHLLTNPVSRNHVYLQQRFRIITPDRTASNTIESKRQTGGSSDEEGWLEQFQYKYFQDKSNS